MLSHIHRKIDKRKCKYSIVLTHVLDTCVLSTRYQLPLRKLISMVENEKDDELMDLQWSLFIAAASKISHLTICLWTQLQFVEIRYTHTHSHSSVTSSTPVHSSLSCKRHRLAVAFTSLCALCNFCAKYLINTHFCSRGLGLGLGTIASQNTYAHSVPL